MRRAVLAACVALVALSPRVGFAATPEWARDHVKTPVPQGGYIAKGDEWVAVYSELEIGGSAGGGLSRIYRQVFAPNGGQKRRLTLWMPYDEVTQVLIEPKVWIPGRFAAFRELKIQKRAIDVPDLDSQMVVSSRGLVITTEEIAPGERAIVSWQVDDRQPFPGEEWILPFSAYPTAEWHVRAAAGGAPVHLVLVEPQPGQTPRIREGRVELAGLPALRRIYQGNDPLVGSPMEALPYVLASVARSEGRSWNSLARDSAALFHTVLEGDSREGLRARAAALTEGAATTLEKVARLAAFTQSLTYRNVAWGEGAYRPEAPSETLRTMSADCKGKVALLQGLVREVGVASTPVIAYSDQRYLDALPLPTVHAFNHVVLAIRLPENADLPGTLTEGPGRGWILFDPTHPLSTFGRPPIDLELTRALWADPQAGDLFTVRTLAPGGESTVLRLDMRIAGPDEARLDLTIEGSGDLLASLSGSRLYGEDREKFRARCQEILQPAAPGLVVTEAGFDPPDHPNGREARLRLAGQIRAPLQSLGGNTFSLPAPPALMGWCSGVPRHGYKKGAGEKDGVETRPEWKAERCCRGVPARLRGEVRLALPEGWSAVAQPEREIDAPWIHLRAQGGEPWVVTIDWPRGRFPTGSGDRMLQDLNGVASMFRQSFLVKAPGG